MFVEQEFYETTYPPECTNSSCGTKNEKYFKTLREESTPADYQEITLINWPRREGWKKAENKLEVLLLDDLIEQCEKNDIVTITGILVKKTKSRTKSKKRLIANNIKLQDIRLP